MHQTLGRKNAASKSNFASSIPLIILLQTTNLALLVLISFPRERNMSWAAPTVCFRDSIYMYVHAGHIIISYHNLQSQIKMKVTRHFCCCSSIKGNISLRRDPPSPREMYKAGHSFQSVNYKSFPVEICSAKKSHWCTQTAVAVVLSFHFNLFCAHNASASYRSSRMLPLKTTL